MFDIVLEWSRLLTFWNVRDKILGILIMFDNVQLCSKMFYNVWLCLMMSNFTPNSAKSILALKLVWPTTWILSNIIEHNRTLSNIIKLPRIIEHYQIPRTSRKDITFSNILRPLEHLRLAIHLIRPPRHLSTCVSLYM